MSDWEEETNPAPSTTQWSPAVHPGLGRGRPVIANYSNASGSGVAPFGGFSGDRSGPVKSNEPSLHSWPGGDSFGAAGRGTSGSDGDRGSRACFKCGQSGHIAKDCPNAAAGIGGGRPGTAGYSVRPGAAGLGETRRGCHKCGEMGHFARECPQQSSGGFSGRPDSTGFGGPRSGCHTCGEVGHFARECPQQSNEGQPRRDGSGFGGAFRANSGQSSNYFGKGTRQGSQEGGFGRSGAEGSSFGAATQYGSGCRKCGEEGHFARECPKDEAAAGRPKVESYIPPERTDDDAGEACNIGINFDNYDTIPVDMSGRDPVIAINSFDEAGLLETLRLNVSRANYTKPTPVQKYAIPAVMAGRDLMACAQTGSGKTAAFLLPVLAGIVTNGLVSSGSAMAELQEPAALVIAPTRELADQIHQEARKFSRGTVVRAVVAYGGVTPSYQISQIKNGTNILVATPGRLIDFVNRGVVGLRKVRYLILDEADRMLDMGFMPDVRQIIEKLGIPSKSDRQTLMFSATFPKDIQELAAEFLNDYLFLTVGRVGGANQDVQQTILHVNQQEKRDRLVELLNSNTETQLTLVFVELKRTCDFLASYLSQSGFRTTSIHGDRLQREREEALVDFKRGKSPVLVATSVAARGLDIPKVSHVVNYDMPGSIDEYVHRIGRTGRCGNVGRATSFFDPSCNMDIARALVSVLEEAHQDVPEFLEDAAQHNLGGGRFGGGRGSQNRDARMPRHGGGPSAFAGRDEYEETSAFASSSSAPEESWD